MALRDDIKTAVEAKYSSKRLIQLTNHDTDGVTTVNDTILLEAIDDTIAEFDMEAGLAPTTLAIQLHETLLCEGTIIRLHTYNAIIGDGADKALERWRERCRKLNDRGARPADSNSNYEVSTEPSGKPPFDRRHMQGYTAQPRVPRTAVAEDPDETGS